MTVRAALPAGSGVRVIAAPCNLGLRPLRPGHIPGTWRAPAALIAKGLMTAVGSETLVELPRPSYSSEPQSGTRLLNGPALRAFNLALAEEVDRSLDDGKYPLVVGGDCSVLLGALAGARRHGPLALVHIDGHSDFRHPGNYDPARSLGAVAGMDLALATGRGEALMTDWPDVPTPLVADDLVVQLGEREGHDPDFAWPDVNQTKMTRIDVFEANRIGPVEVIRRIQDALASSPTPRFWLHIDVDVLDQSDMPAVDSPGSPGIAIDDLALIGSTLVGFEQCVGMTLTVFDPDLDVDDQYAQAIVSLISRFAFDLVLSKTVSSDPNQITENVTLANAIANGPPRSRGAVNSGKRSNNPVRNEGT
jgi:arginase